MRVLFYTQVPDVTYGACTFPSEKRFDFQWVDIDSLDGHCCDFYVIFHISIEGETTSLAVESLQTGLLSSKTIGFFNLESNCRDHWRFVLNGRIKIKKWTYEEMEEQLNKLKKIIDKEK